MFILIESKDEIKKRSLKSPDYADALMLTYCNFKPEKIASGNDKNVIYSVSW